MGRRINTEKLEQKIEKVENAIGRNREQYDMLTAKLEELHNQQRQLQCEELLKVLSVTLDGAASVRLNEAV